MANAMGFTAVAPRYSLCAVNPTAFAPGLLATECTEHAPGLRARLVEFALRVGVDHDAGAGAEPQLVAFHFTAADQDVQVHVAVAIEPAHRAGVGATAHAFQFGDDLHAAHLRATGDGAAREHRGDDPTRRRVRQQRAAHVADDVVHVRVD